VVAAFASLISSSKTKTSSLRASGPRRCAPELASGNSNAKLSESDLASVAKKID
jgi:hypothetical protein